MAVVLVGLDVLDAQRALQTPQLQVTPPACSTSQFSHIKRAMQTRSRVRQAATLGNMFLQLIGASLQKAGYCSQSHAAN